MRILGIGGFARGSGKSTLVVRVLEALPRWGSLKSSPGPHRHGLEGSWDLSIAPRLATPIPSAWLRSAGPPPREAVEAVRSHFAGSPGLVVEGITASVALGAERIYLVVRAGGEEVKPSAVAVLPRVEAIVLNRSDGDAPRDVAAARALVRASAPRARVVEVDASNPSHAGTRALIGEILSWAEGP